MADVCENSTCPLYRSLCPAKVTDILALLGAQVLSLNYKLSSKYERELTMKKIVLLLGTVLLLETAAQAQNTASSILLW